MKASIKFREEKKPLLRAKLPFKAGVIPLCSGIVAGNSEELAVNLGTSFLAGPSIKLAFRPSDSNSLSVVVKTGFGLWGSANDAPLTLKAEFFIVPKAGDPLLTLRLKPRVGDFSILKDVNCASFLPLQRKAKETALVQALNENSLAVIPMDDKLVLSTPPPLVNGDVKTTPKRVIGNFADKDRTRSLAVDSNAVVIGSNFSLKIEGLDKDWKVRNDRKLKGEGHDTDVDAMPNGNGAVLHSPHQGSHQNGGKEGQRSTVFSFARAQSCLQGCKIVAHSILPIGPQVRVNFQWGVKPPRELLQGWDGSPLSLSVSKLPSLLFDKITIERVRIPAEKPKAANYGYVEGGLIPISFLEENRELAQVASLCYTMKRQLYLLYAENQVLRRSMEDMRSQVELRGFRMMSGADDNHAPKEQLLPPNSPFMDSSRPSHSGREEDSRKFQREAPRKDVDPSRLDLDAMPSVGGTGSDVSKQLERAIKGVKNGGKKD